MNQIVLVFSILMSLYSAYSVRDANGMMEKARRESNSYEFQRATTLSLAWLISTIFFALLGVWLRYAESC
jgi:uncharacterized membrane protein